MAEKKSGFHYLGIGCLIAGAVLVLGTVVCGYAVFRWQKGLEADLEDPDARRSQVLEVLGGDNLPEGYYPMIGVRIPMFLETAILTDRETGLDDKVPDLGERGLIYFSMRDFGRDRQDLDDFFNGRRDDPEVLEKHQIDVDLGERVASGRVDRPTGPILWVSHRGDMADARASGRHEGLITLMQINCPPDSYNRLALWFGPDPREAADGELLAGSVADPQGVEDFVSHFRFCPD